MESIKHLFTALFFATATTTYGADFEDAGRYVAYHINPPAPLVMSGKASSTYENATAVMPEWRGGSYYASNVGKDWPAGYPSSKFGTGLFYVLSSTTQFKTAKATEKPVNRMGQRVGNNNQMGNITRSLGTLRWPGTAGGAWVLPFKGSGKYELGIGLTYLPTYESTETGTGGFYKQSYAYPQASMRLLPTINTIFSKKSYGYNQKVEIQNHLENNWIPWHYGYAMPYIVQTTGSNPKPLEAGAIIPALQPKGYSNQRLVIYDPYLNGRKTTLSSTSGSFQITTGSYKAYPGFNKPKSSNRAENPPWALYTFEIEDNLPDIEEFKNIVIADCIGGLYGTLTGGSSHWIHIFDAGIIKFTPKHPKIKGEMDPQNVNILEKTKGKIELNFTLKEDK
jgi:hypothetical protein